MTNIIGFTNMPMLPALVAVKPIPIVSFIIIILVSGSSIIRLWFFRFSFFHLTPYNNVYFFFLLPIGPFLLPIPNPLPLPPDLILLPGHLLFAIVPPLINMGSKV